MNYSKSIVDGVRVIGDAIAEWRSQIAAKNVLDPVAFKTEADIRANDLYFELIRELDPEVSIISEESFAPDVDRPSRYWLIDPIDGTASWYGGFPGFVTQIAYIDDGVPVFSVVYAPVINKLWVASRRGGAFLNGIRINPIEKCTSLKLIDNYPEPRGVAKLIFNSIEGVEYLECGSIGLKSCLVADGTADLFVKDVVIRDWDIAPAMLILHEVGAIMCDLKGRDIVLEGSFDKNSGLIVSRDHTVCQKIIDIVS